MAGLFLISRSEEHTSELQSRLHLVCRLLLEKKKNTDPGWPHNPRLARWHRAIAHVSACAITSSPQWAKTLNRRVGIIICLYLLFFFNDTATTEIYTLSLHDALPISRPAERFKFPDQRQDFGRVEEFRN